MKNSMLSLIITLTIIGIISASILAFVFQWTSPYIEEHNLEAKKEAVLTVLPGVSEYEQLVKNGKVFYEGFNKQGQRIGIAVIAKGSGFQGEIELMIGTDPVSEKILGLKVLSHQETPGLGARITNTGYKNNFKDKPFGEYEVIKREAETPYQVEAISGATISSEKVTDIVEKAVKQVQKVYGGEA